MTITLTEVVGTTGDDTFTGADNTIFYGGDGDDLFQAAAGTFVSIFYGGGGNNRYVIDQAGTSIVWSTGTANGQGNVQGSDTLVLTAVSSTNGADVTYTLIDGRHLAIEHDITGEEVIILDYATANIGTVELIDGTFDYQDLAAQVEAAGFDRELTWEQFQENTSFTTQDINETFDFYANGPVGVDPNAFNVIEGTDDADNLIGTDGDDSISGLEGSDSVLARAGNDILDGGAGNDTLNGGDGADTLRGGAGNDNIFGGAGDDVIDTGTAEQGEFEFIEGGDGNDLITAGDGGFTDIEGGRGNDTVDATNDPNAAIVHFSVTNGIDVDLEAGVAANDGYGDTDTLINIRNVIGSSFDDIIRGSEEDDPFLLGGGGNDTLLGRGGDDFLGGGNGDDYLDGEAGADRLSGDSGNDTIIGGSGIDTIFGGDGDDSITAGGNDESGAESVSGGDGNDLITVVAGGASNSQTVNVEGEAGIDTIIATDAPGVIVSYNAAEAGVVVDLLAGVTSNDGYGSSDVLVDVTNVSGSLFDDFVTGSASNDFIDGDDGNDTLVGGDGSDFLRGAGGNDLIRGGDGNDVIAGGAGVDTLVGDAGADIFRFSESDPVGAGNTGIITDFVVGEDNLEFDFAPGTLTVVDVAGDAVVRVAATGEDVVIVQGVNADDLASTLDGLLLDPFVGTPGDESFTVTTGSVIDYTDFVSGNDTLVNNGTILSSANAAPAPVGNPDVSIFFRAVVQSAGGELNVTNSGTITGQGFNAGISGIDTSIILDNQIGAEVSGGALGVLGDTGSVITNAGSITGNTALVLFGDASTVVNTGEIVGDPSLGFFGPEVSRGIQGAVLDLENSGTISGSFVPNGNGVIAGGLSGASTILNSGTISGYEALSIRAASDAAITNDGSILAGGISVDTETTGPTAISVGAAQSTDATVTITNTGTISVDAPGNPNLVLADQGTAIFAGSGVTLVNSGIIEGPLSFSGIELLDYRLVANIGAEFISPTSNLAALLPFDAELLAIPEASIAVLNIVSYQGLQEVAVAGALQDADDDFNIVLPLFEQNEQGLYEVVTDADGAAVFPDEITLADGRVVTVNETTSELLDADGNFVVADLPAALGAYADNITNSSEMSGDVVLGLGDDVLTSTGSIDGNVTGGEGDDRIDLAGVNGTVDGGNGDDIIMLGADNDTVSGGAGNDLIRGGDGNDRIVGGDGDDTLIGQAGSDTLIGGAGNDMIFGGAGADLIVFDGQGDDTLANFARNDTLDLSGLTSVSSIEDVLAVASQVEGGILLDFGDEGSVLLQGYNALLPTGFNENLLRSIDFTF